MPRKHRQLNAPCPKASGNAFQALVDPPNHGNHFSFDGGDERTNENDDNTVVIANLRESIEMYHKNEKRLYKIDERVIGLCNNQYRHFEDVNSKMDNLLQKMDAAWTENTALREAYRASREETAALKAAVDALMKKLEENTVTSAPPSPDTTASSTAMEEMTMQLSHVQHDIQDVLDAVHNCPGKRKRRTSDQINEPTTPMNRRPATQRHQYASPEPRLMHSCHATSATQEALDALRIKFPPC
jgi:sulfite reductase alpha subunit-like flavoprotein